MSTSEILAGLRDVQEPLPPEATLPWLLLANVSIVVIILGVLFHRRRQARRAWRNQALAEIGEASRWQPQKAQAGLAMTLRKIMLHREGPEINALSGEAWLHRLDRDFDTDWFSSGAGRLFGNTLYEPCRLTRTDVADLCKQLSALVQALPSVPSSKASSQTLAPSDPSAP